MQANKQLVNSENKINFYQICFMNFTQFNFLHQQLYVLIYLNVLIYSFIYLCKMLIKIILLQWTDYLIPNECVNTQLIMTFELFQTVEKGQNVGHAKITILKGVTVSLCWVRLH